MKKTHVTFKIVKRGLLLIKNVLGYTLPPIFYAHAIAVMMVVRKSSVHTA